MNDKDRRILRQLRSNARMNLTTLSRNTGMPVSTIFDRISRKEGNCITRFTALVDFAKLGYPVRANVFLKADPCAREALKAYLLMHDRVNNLYRINNGFDYSVECVFLNIKEVEEFIEEVETQFAVSDARVFHIIDDLARERFFAADPAAPM